MLRVATFCRRPIRDAMPGVPSALDSETILINELAPGSTVSAKVRFLADSSHLCLASAIDISYYEIIRSTYLANISGILSRILVYVILTLNQ